MGGWYGGYINSVETLSPGGTWTNVQPLPEMRLFASMTRVSGKALIVGGAQHSGGWIFRNKTLEYDHGEDVWTEVPQLSLAEGQLMRQSLFSVPSSMAI